MLEPRQNAKWSFTLSSNRLQTGGWVRQQNGGSSESSELYLRSQPDTELLVDSMPIAKSGANPSAFWDGMYSQLLIGMAGVNMRLEPGAIR